MKDTEQISMTYESSLVFPHSHLLKHVVAFTNSRGGAIAIGVDDSDHIDGIPSSALFYTIEAIEEAVICGCDPPIIPDTKIQEVNGKNVLLIHIPRGMQRPYCIKDEGLLDGVYVRVDGTTRRASRHLVKDLILQGQGRDYDQEIIEDHIVSEEVVNELCADMYTIAKENANGRLVKPITKQQLISWNLLSEQNGLLVASQRLLLLMGSSLTDADAQIQCATFKGTTRARFLDRRDVSGPLYRQVQDAYVFVMQHIQLRIHFDGVYRKERYELPDEAVRELIANAVCHRSYLAPEKIQIALYDDRLEITSPRMLYGNLTIEEMIKRHIEAKKSSYRQCICVHGNYRKLGKWNSTTF